MTFADSFLYSDFLMLPVLSEYFKLVGFLTLLATILLEPVSFNALHIRYKNSGEV